MSHASAVKRFIVDSTPLQSTTHTRQLVISDHDPCFSLIHRLDMQRAHLWMNSHSFFSPPDKQFHSSDHVLVWLFSFMWPSYNIWSFSRCICGMKELVILLFLSTFSLQDVAWKCSSTLLGLSGRIWHFERPLNVDVSILMPRCQAPAAVSVWPFESDDSNFMSTSWITWKPRFLNCPIFRSPTLNARQGSALCGACGVTLMEIESASP